MEIQGSARDASQRKPRSSYFRCVTNYSSHLRNSFLVFTDILHCTSLAPARALTGRWRNLSDELYIIIESDIIASSLTPFPEPLSGGFFFFICSCQSVFQPAPCQNPTATKLFPPSGPVSLGGGFSLALIVHIMAFDNVAHRMKLEKYQEKRRGERGKKV